MCSPGRLVPGAPKRSTKPEVPYERSPGNSSQDSTGDSAPAAPQRSLGRLLPSPDGAHAGVEARARSRVLGFHLSPAPGAGAGNRVPQQARRHCLRCSCARREKRANPASEVSAGEAVQSPGPRRGVCSPGIPSGQSRCGHRTGWQWKLHLSLRPRPSRKRPGQSGGE